MNPAGSGQLAPGPVFGSISVNGFMNSGETGNRSNCRTSLFAPLCATASLATPIAITPAGASAVAPIVSPR